MSNVWPTILESFWAAMAEEKISLKAGKFAGHFSSSFQSPSLAAGADSGQNLFNLWTPTSVSSATGIRQGVAGCGISLRPRSRSPRILKVPLASVKKRENGNVESRPLFSSTVADPARDDRVRSVSSRLLRMFLFSPLGGLPSSTQKFGILTLSCLLCLRYMGHRLYCEKAVIPHLRPHRLLVHSRCPVRIGQEIRHGCEFLHGLFRSLGHLPGGLARFIPCRPYAHYTGLLHVGRGQCGHGLSSRPRESCDAQVVKPLLDFFGYPEATKFYSSLPFSKRFPSCSVPDLSSTSPGPGCIFLTVTL